jgi:hypothetical protein
MAHHFNENNEMELTAASRNSITIGERVSFGHTWSNIVFQFFKETIMQHETSQETTVGISKKEFTTASHCELKRVRNHSRC